MRNGPESCFEFVLLEVSLKMQTKGYLNSKRKFNEHGYKHFLQLCGGWLV